MAVTVSVKSNVKSIQKNLNKFVNKFPRITRKALLQASFQLQAIIKELTRREQDFRRRRFAPYSEGYLKTLQREGKLFRPSFRKPSNDIAPYQALQ